MFGGINGKINELIKKAEECQKLTITAGILEGATYPDGMSVAEVAKMMEFGVPEKGIPPRPFLRNSANIFGPNWIQQLQSVLANQYFDGDWDLYQCGDLVAGQIGPDIQATIDMGVPPSSSQATIKRKVAKYGEDRGPLRDTYEMYRSVRTEVDVS